MSNFSERLKELRIERNLTQKQLAEEINVNNSSIAYWESNKYEPKAGYIIALVKFFGVSSDYLLGITDN